MNVPSASVPTAHSISKVTRAVRPCAAALAAIRRANAREHPIYGAPSWVYLSTGTHAQPGWAASGVSLLTSGTSRRSPAGPPMCLLVVMLSSTSNTGDMPIPQPAARSSRPVGMALTRVIPALSTQQNATILTPSSVSRLAAVRPSAERLARSRVSSTASSEVCVVTEHLASARPREQARGVRDGTQTASARQSVTGAPAIPTQPHNRAAELVKFLSAAVHAEPGPALLVATLVLVRR